MTVLIAGGGIGGLTLALSLHQIGVKCRVFESVQEIKPLGVGINVLPHACRELIELGLHDELDRTGVRTSELAYYSKHGRANAIDIRAIVMNDGRRFGVDLQETPLQLLYDLRRGACAHFTTVLGPGSDGYHENHFHLDLAQRRNGYRICQWNVPAPPVPAPNPLRVRYP